MPIIIKIGQTAREIFWAIIALLGVILTMDGFFYTINGFMTLGHISLTNTVALSHISGGVIISIIGLVVVVAGALGIRGRIIITTS